MTSVEHMVGLVMSTINTVIIPTVGIGFRLAPYTDTLNKALVPYKEKPILSHIIEQFPINSNFIIPVGHMAQQVIDFCSLAFSDRNITFVPVDDWTSEKSGTAYSLKQCEPYVNGAFWYVPCDTYFNETISPGTEDCYYVKTVADDLTDRYTTFLIENNRISSMLFKEHSIGVAYTGVTYIHEWKDFFVRLNALRGVEFISIIKSGTLVKSLPTWMDIGSIDLYENMIHASQKFDFSKPGELTYICNGKVAKWWFDESIARKKYTKTLTNPTVYPNNCQHQNNWMTYDFFPGETLYQHNNPTSFPRLLSWLHEKVWIRSTEDIGAHSLKFYRDKTMSRINQFKASHHDRLLSATINGLRVDESILDRINWNLLTNTNLSGLMHGDLQFDNIIVNEKDEFTLIDWRHEFAGLIDSGDIYYDLAKLAGGLIINYSLIKQNSFSVQLSGNEVTIDVPSVEHLDKYQQLLDQYIKDNGLSLDKVRLLVPIIFLNMSPLHASPFDLLLWYLGLKMLHETIL